MPYAADPGDVCLCTRDADGYCAGCRRMMALTVGEMIQAQQRAGEELQRIAEKLGGMCAVCHTEYLDLAFADAVEWAGRAVPDRRMFVTTFELLRKQALAGGAKAIPQMEKAYRDVCRAQGWDSALPKEEEDDDGVKPIL